MEILNVNGQLTMTSIAIVEYINAERGDSVAQLRYSDFLEKVIAVLSEEMSGKFRSSYLKRMLKGKPEAVQSSQLKAYVGRLRSWN